MRHQTCRGWKEKYQRCKKLWNLDVFTKISLISINACKVLVNLGCRCGSPQALWWSTTCSHSASGMWILGDLGWPSRSPTRSELRVSLLFT